MHHLSGLCTVPVQLLALHMDTCGLNSPSECKVRYTKNILPVSLFKFSQQYLFYFILQIISDDESSLESIIDDADDFDNQNVSSIMCLLKLCFSTFANGILK